MSYELCNISLLFFPKVSKNLTNSLVPVVLWGGIKYIILLMVAITILTVNVHVYIAVWFNAKCRFSKEMMKGYLFFSNGGFPNLCNGHTFG